MLWSEFVIGDESGLLSDSESRIERLWLHGSWSCSPSLREYRFSTYSNTPRATARPHWQCREVLHRPLAVTEDWEDPPCTSGPCGYMLSAHERDDESGKAAEHADDPVAAYSGKHQMPLDPIENTGKEQRELLCS